MPQSLSVLVFSSVCAAADTGPLPRGVDAPVLREPSVQEFWSFLRNYKEVPLQEFDVSKSPAIPRVKDLDDETFQQLIRDGVPFVVDDCTAGFDQDAISEFKCKDFAERWPSGNMRAEYTPGQYHIYLKDSDWYSRIHPQRSHSEHMAGENKIAGPYIWHVKDEEPLKTKREVQKHWRTPYFLEKSIANRMEANESFEFWFSMAGGGTFTHADAYCESTISMQFKGKKRWRIQAFPEIQHYFNASSFGDEQIYGGKQHVKWTPETEFTVGPGQCFVFPTGYLHETFVDPEGNDDGCYTASTFQFNHPRQVNLYRSYMSRFAMSHYGMGEPCLQKVSSYSTLLQRDRWDQEPDRARNREKAEHVIKKMDLDGDGKLDKKELYAEVTKSSQQKKEVLAMGDFRYNWERLLSKKDLKELKEEAIDVWAEDALQYHDLDRDRKISADELAYNFLHWNVIQYRAEKIKRRHQKEKDWAKAVLESEKDILKRFYCADPTACPALEELERYGEALLKSKKLRKAKMRHIERMGGGEEQDEELTFVDRKTGESERMKTSEVQGSEL